MPFFQNPFYADAYLTWNLSRQHSPTFLVRGGANSSLLMHSGHYGPYDLSSETDITIFYCVNPDADGIFRDYHELTIDVSTSAATVATAQAHEIVAALNNDDTFVGLFTAEVIRTRNSLSKVAIRANRKDRFRFYIANSGAETILKFNLDAGVAELPVALERHTVANARTYIDSLATLIELDPMDLVDAQVITDAGLNPNVEQTFGTTIIYDDEVLTAGAGNDTTDSIDKTAFICDSALLIKITNGATGPTVAAQVQIQISSDDVNYFNFGSAMVGSTTNNAVSSWSVEIPGYVRYFKVISTAGTDQNVTLRVEYIEVVNNS